MVLIRHFVVVICLVVLGLVGADGLVEGAEYAGLASASRAVAGHRPHPDHKESRPRTLLLAENVVVVLLVVQSFGLEPGGERAGLGHAEIQREP